MLKNGNVRLENLNMLILSHLFATNLVENDQT